jgi:hypothetical protein
MNNPVDITAYFNIIKNSFITAMINKLSRRSSKKYDYYWGSDIRCLVDNIKTKLIFKKDDNNNESKYILIIYYSAFAECIFEISFDCSGENLAVKGSAKIKEFNKNKEIEIKEMEREYIISDIDIKNGRIDFIAVAIDKVFNDLLKHKGWKQNG